MHTIHTLTNQGLTAVPVTIEITTTSGIPEIVLIGLANKTIVEAKDRIITALKFWNVKIKARKIVINLRPADLKKNGSHYDLAIAVGLLNLFNNSNISTKNTIFLGELSLDGTLQPLSDSIRKVQSAIQLGYTQVIVPHANAKELQIIQGITIKTVTSIGQLLSQQSLQKLPTLKQKIPKFEAVESNIFDSLKNQEDAKRAAIIAVAGHHHLHLVGPPGLGKTSIATAVQSLLPPLSYQQQIELLSVYEAAQDQKINNRPLRSPNSHVSRSQLFGSNQRLLPGEASLAHAGILFFDEVNQASTEVLQGLRKVLDQKQVVLSNASGSAIYPADFILLAASNPCPCGYWGTQVRSCKCTQSQRAHFVSKLSASLLDRIDMQIKMESTDTISNHETQTFTVDQARHVITKALQKQTDRFKASQLRYNSDLTLENYPKFITLSLPADMLLNRSILKYKLSYRAIEKILGVAQTICDLSADLEISVQHMREALTYRFEQHWEEVTK